MAVEEVTVRSQRELSGRPANEPVRYTVSAPYILKSLRSKCGRVNVRDWRGCRSCLWELTVFRG